MPQQVGGGTAAVDEVDLKTVSFLKRMDGVEIDEAASASYASLPMRMDMAPFDNHDVRMALKFAMNREEWIQKIRRAFATIGNDHPIGSAMPFHACDIEQRPYDPDQARHHLKKAGLDSLKVDFHVSRRALRTAASTPPSSTRRRRARRVLRST